MRRLAFALLTLAAACGGGSEPPPDATVDAMPDAPPPDATPPPDSYVPPDARIPDDAAAPGPIAPSAETMIGSPTWRITDWQLIAAPMGDQTSNFAQAIATLQAIFPLHIDYPALNFFGPDPMSPHPPPYDTETSTGVAAAGFVNNRVQPRTAFDAPSGIFLIGMIVPLPTAPVGESPDFMSGPIIADVQWPFEIDTDLYWNGVLRDPLFDSTYPRIVDIPIYVAGYSHMTLVFAENTEFISGEVGNYQWVIRVTDGDGNGWMLTLPFWAEPVD